MLEHSKSSALRRIRNTANPPARIGQCFSCRPISGWSLTTPRLKAFEESSHDLNAIVLKTEGNIPGLEAQVRRAIAQVNADLAVIDFMSFATQVDGNFAQQEMLAKLTSLFGLLALALASVGLYGVTAYSVERRTSEIGIRMALGADRLSVLKLVMHGAFLQIGIGLAIGIPITILAGRAMTHQLFGVKPYAPDILLVTTLSAELCSSHRYCLARSTRSSDSNQFARYERSDFERYWNAQEATRSTECASKCFYRPTTPSMASPKSFCRCAPDRTDSCSPLGDQPSLALSGDMRLRTNSSNAECALLADSLLWS